MNLRIEQTILRKLLTDEKYMRKVLPFIKPSRRSASAKSGERDRRIRYVVQHVGGCVAEGYAARITDGQTPSGLVDRAWIVDADTGWPAARR